jgi:hypothetical protein
MVKWLDDSIDPLAIVFPARSTSSIAIKSKGVIKFRVAPASMGLGIAMTEGVWLPFSGIAEKLTSVSVWQMVQPLASVAQTW